MQASDQPVVNALPATVLSVDKKLHELVKDIDILDAVAPSNYVEQKALFFDRHFSQNPQFSYRKHEIDAFAVKRALFNLPVQDIEDEDLQQLYIAVINSYVDKIEQFRSIGSPEFLYDSLRYYGEPSPKDLRNAHFILHLPVNNDHKTDHSFDASQIKALLGQFANKHGYPFEVKIDSGMIANALVSGKVLKINSAANISANEANALAHHELGVHLVTTLNAHSQPLNILRLGCPANTMTQEGLAILSEYLAGFMSVNRLRTLALRVLAVDSMLKEKDFGNTFALLKEQYNVPDNQAFTITARVYRGGGYTKDYLYLQGFHQLLNEYENSRNISALLAGKTSLNCLALLNRLMDKGILRRARLITPSINKPVKVDKIMQFVASAIK